MVYKALIWLQKNNPIYIDIQVDSIHSNELPKDDVPEVLLSIICQENDDEIAEKERESYLCDERKMDSEDAGVNDVNEIIGQRLNVDVTGES